MQKPATAIILLTAAALLQTAGAKTIHLSPNDDWFGTLSGPSLRPGDEIVLAAGTYSDRRRLQISHRGTSGNPVTIRAADAAKVVFKRPDARQNTINMGGCQYLVLKGIEITGGDAGIRNNIIFDTRGDGIHCRNHQSAVVGNLKIVHNTVLASSSIRIVPPNIFSGVILVANNAVGGSLRIPASPEITSSSNVTGTSENFPSAGSKCIGAADPNHLAKDDFNGTRRSDSKDAGAYVFNPAGNPGWKIAPGFKDK